MKEWYTVIGERNVGIGDLISYCSYPFLNSMFPFYPTFKFNLIGTVIIGLMPLVYYWVVFPSIFLKKILSLVHSNVICIAYFP